MSFQNSGTTPDGQVIYRGDPILVEYSSHLLCGRISEISTGSGGEVFVTATLDTGVLNTMGGDASKNVPDVKYVGTGYYHQSTKQVRGENAARPTNLFCLAHETPTFAMGEAPGTVHEQEHAEAVDRGNDPGKTAPLEVTGKPADQVAEDGEVFAPADTNKDGVISRKETKDFKKKHPEG